MKSNRILFTAMLLLCFYQLSSSISHSAIKNYDFKLEEGWYVVSEKSHLDRVINEAVTRKIKDYNGKPLRFNKIPEIDQRWSNQKREHQQQWDNKYRELHHDWQNNFINVSKAKNGHQIRGTLNSAIEIIKETILTLKKQKEHEKQIFKKDLEKIHRSTLVWGKAIYGTGDSKELTSAQIEEQINQALGVLAIERINSAYIQNLTIVKDNQLILDEIKSKTQGHFRGVSSYPDPVSKLDGNNDEWTYRFYKIEVYPFPKSSAKSSQAKLFGNVKKGELTDVKCIKEFIENEGINDHSLKKWLKEELYNLDIENLNTENEIKRSIEIYKKRTIKINEVIGELGHRLNNMRQEYISLPDKDKLESVRCNFIKSREKYIRHYSQRVILDTKKISGRRRHDQRLEDVFVSIVKNAWESYELNVGDYTEEILVENGEIASFTRRKINWKYDKRAFKILYLSRREIGSKLEYIAHIGIKVNLVEQERLKDDKEISVPKTVCNKHKKLKIVLFKDETIKINPRIVILLNNWSTVFEFSWGKANFAIPGNIIKLDHRINQDILTETENVFAVYLCTKKPYDNNYFTDILDNTPRGRMIFSFFGWENLTNLSENNGLINFIVYQLVGLFGRELTHKKCNTGCIYDFLNHKPGIDEVMKSSYFCSEHREIVKKFLSKSNESYKCIFHDVQTLLEKLGEASKHNKDVINYYLEAK